MIGALQFLVEPNGDVDGAPAARCPRCLRLAARLPHETFTLAHLITEADAHLASGCPCRDHDN